MNTLTRIVPIVVATLCVLWLVGKAMPPRDAEGEPAIHAFAQLPLVYQGRVKPFDTLARNSLIILSDRQSWRDEEGRKRPAIEWLLDVMSGSPRGREHAVFRIHNLQLLTQLELEPRRGYRYSFDELAPRLIDIERQAMHAGDLTSDERDVYDVKVLELWRKIMLHHVLVETHAAGDLTSGPGGLDGAIHRVERIERLSAPHVIPPLGDREEWRPMLRAALDDAMTADADPAVEHMAALLAAWRDDDSAAFNSELAAYQTLLGETPALRAPVLGFEADFNHFAPFYHCAVLYVLAFLIGCVGWLTHPELFRRTAYWLLSATFIVHVLAIASRVYISGYPPITNLYGTAVFIGAGCVMLGLMLERLHPLGVGNMLAAAVGFVTLLIAHFLAGDGDTLEMMQAVLDTKFWL
ncbi:MAG: hypothetical protein KJO43_02940, partial [Phycisphaerae bacterium]|nr:hypothetical protein [Phycisphaerae bacterium]